MRERTGLIALLVLLGSFFASAALASPVAGYLPTASDIREGRYLLAPQAYLSFCSANPGDCGAADETVLTLTSQDWALLHSVNGTVNRSIQPVALSGADIWALGRRSGHCATFAVQKRHELIKAGLPRSALSLAVVYTEQGDRHLVLTVRTDHGAFVLDNLRPAILPWLSTGYRFDKIQSQHNPNFWKSVSGSSSPQVAKLMFAGGASSAR